MNWKWFGRKWSWLNGGTIPVYCWRDWVTLWKIPVRTADVTAEIRIRTSSEYKCKVLPLYHQAQFNLPRRRWYVIHLGVLTSNCNEYIRVDISAIRPQTLVKWSGQMSSATELAWQDLVSFGGHRSYISGRIRNSSATAQGSTQPLNQRSPVALYSEIKLLGHEADHSLPFSAEVRNAWSCTSITSYVVIALCYVSTRAMYWPTQIFFGLMQHSRLSLFRSRFYIFTQSGRYPRHITGILC
jgi:hypothetical protein